MSLKQNAEDSAERCYQWLVTKHGQRAVLVAKVVSDAEISIGVLDLSKAEWQSVIQELQAAFDDHTAFHDQN